MSLLVDWCSNSAASYAVLRWHYSRKMPVFKLARLGAWENGNYIGTIIFANGSNPQIHRPFGLDRLEVCELVRIALCSHSYQVSQILSRAIRKLKVFAPKLRLIVSYADTQQGHIGIVYQAANWVYLGSNTHYVIQVNGVMEHPRTIGTRYGTEKIRWLRKHVDPLAKIIATAPKFKYAYPLDKGMRRHLLQLAKPYPKRVPEEGLSDHERKDGSNPFHTLQSEEKS